MACSNNRLTDFDPSPPNFEISISFWEKQKSQKKQKKKKKVEIKGLYPCFDCLPEEVVLTIQFPFSWKTLLCQSAFAVAALDTLDMPRSVQNFE